MPQLGKNWNCLLYTSKEKLEGTGIATDGIAVIVNKANPTEEMTSDQVKSIYLGDVLTWDEIAE